MKIVRSLRLIALSLATLVVLAGTPFAIQALSPDAVNVDWSNFTPDPAGWVGSLPVTSTVTAVDADGFAAQSYYQISTNGGASWSGWITTGLVSSNPTTTTRLLTATNLALGQGLNFIQFRVIDGLGNTGNSPAYPINVDTIAPPSPINPQPDPAGWTNANSFTATWTNPIDPTGIGGVWYRLDSAPIADDDGIFVAGDDITTLTGVSVGAHGAHDLWLWLADKLGHADHSSAVTVSLHLDVIAPTGLTDVTVAPSGWTNVNQFDMNWMPPIDDSGIGGVRHKLGPAPGNAQDGEFWPGATNGYAGYVIPGNIQGTHDLWLWPTDGAGNAAAPGDAVSVTLRLDMTPPGPPVTVPQVTPSGWQTSTTTTYTLSWTNPADLSGIAGACYKIGAQPQANHDGVCVSGDNLTEITGIAPTTPGKFHLFLWLEDQAGNINKDSRGVALDAVQWDPSAPSIFVDATGPQGLEGWYVGDVDLSIIASDEGSGLTDVEYKLDENGWVNGRQLKVQEDGVHTLTVRASDVAGNMTELGPNHYGIDTVPPQTTVDFSIEPVVDNWFGGPVIVSLDSQDDTSGPAYVEWQRDDGPWTRRPTAPVTTAGPHTLHYRSADIAGNVEVTRSVAVNIDLEPPVTSYVILPESPDQGWYAEPVTVTLIPSDDGSGVVDTFYRINNGQWQSGTEFYLTASDEYIIDFYSVDRIGNVEETFRIPGGIRIDTEAPRAPTPVDTSPRGWVHENDFRLTLALPPDLSGIAGLYHKIGAPPTSNTDGTWQAGSTSVLQHVQAPNEGEFKVYVWLQDAAGNVDYTRFGVWQDELALHYDTSPPQTTAQLQGAPGDNDWFVSPVQVTLAPTDSLSGVAETLVSIDGTPPIGVTSFTLSVPDKHTLRYYSRDVAGNQEPENLTTVRIDPDAPDSPKAVSLSPQGWGTVNNFTLHWTNPTDLSGIASGMFKVGDAPSSANDGSPTPPTGLASGITAPGDGSWDLHFWLVDRAGNADIDSRVVMTEAVKFDGTPPATTARILEGTLAPSGWYITSVSIGLTSTDSASGVARMRYRLNGGEWIQASSVATLTFDSTAQYAIEYQAFDVAGNAEAPQNLNVKIDLAPPSPQFVAMDRYQRRNAFTVAWNAFDEIDGSGLYGFDIQVKDGRNGFWTNWGSQNVPDTSGRYFGNPGHRYFFRLRARDHAGHVSPWVEMPWGVYIDRLANGDFAGGSFGAWDNKGVLKQTVIETEDGSGASVYAAQLGSPDYGPNVPGMDIPEGSTGDVPIGSGYIRQTIRIPGADVLDRPTLTLWYRIFTYDTKFGENQQQWFDTLDVRVFGENGDLLLLREGLPYEEWVEGELADLGWRYAHFELPESWKGEVATVSIENWNRIDGRLNTWSQISDVRVWEPYRTYLPQITGGSAIAAQQQSAEPPVKKPSSGLR
ncbi:MAG: fibronectin type III domain-containing protein [Caldilineales bacterium]|nr:fibronectin type III domain-containing protein [Caldilineales bacterium]